MTTRRIVGYVVMVAPFLLALAFVYDVVGVRTAFAQMFASSISDSLGNR